MFLIGLAAALTCQAAPARAQSLTEGEAVRLGLEVAAWREWVDASMEEARNRTGATGRLANPEFEFIDESLDLPGGNTERYYWLRQPLDLTGRKSLERKSARVSEDVTAAGVEQVKRDRAAAIRQAFYQAIRLSRETEVIEVWHDRLGELGQAVAERVQVGDASRFDQLRIEREIKLLQGRLAMRRAGLHAARERLFGLLDRSPRALSGRLLPDEPPAAPMVMQALQRHPEIAQLQAGAEADRLTARAAGREVWPEVTLGVGVREFADAGISETGGVFSVGIEVPLFDRGRQRRAAAEAGAGAKSAETALAIARLEAEARAVLQELQARRQAALAMRAATTDDADSLPSIAEAAYQGGEIGVMSLIDAWQTELDLNLQAIELEYAARLAAIELTQLTGEPR
ncbi:MAG: TolC family protein [Wenzhouxiangellaceae bacterium]